MRSGSNAEALRVVITGAGSGIGLATAELFAAHAAKLAIHSRAPARGARTARPSQPVRDAAEYIDDSDLSSRANAVAFALRAEAVLGHVDLLVTCAGVHDKGPSSDVDWEDWDRLMRVNVDATFACIKVLLPGMLGRGSGRIITLASELALTGMAETAAYCASKGAIVALTKALAREAAPAGVLVNCVAPGPVLTPMMRAAPEFGDGSALAGIPLGRYGTAEEIAELIFALAGGAGSFFVGQVLSPNGGVVI